MHVCGPRQSCNGSSRNERLCYINLVCAATESVYTCHAVSGREEDTFVLTFFHNILYYDHLLARYDPQKWPELARFMQPIEAHAPNMDKSIKVRDHGVPAFVVQKKLDSLRRIACTVTMDAEQVLQVLISGCLTPPCDVQDEGW